MRFISIFFSPVSMRRGDNSRYTLSFHHSILNYYIFWSSFANKCFKIILVSVYKLRHRFKLKLDNISSSNSPFARSESIGLSWYTLMEWHQGRTDHQVFCPRYCIHLPVHIERRGCHSAQLPRHAPTGIISVLWFTGLFCRPPQTVP